MKLGIQENESEKADLTRARKIFVECSSSIFAKVQKEMENVRKRIN